MASLLDVKVHDDLMAAFLAFLSSTMSLRRVLSLPTYSSRGSHCGGLHATKLFLKFLTLTGFSYVAMDVSYSQVYGALAVRYFFKSHTYSRYTSLLFGKNTDGG